MAGEQDGGAGEGREDLLQPAQRVLIECRGGAAADGAGEECIAGDEHRHGEAVDVEAERGIGVAGEIAGADGERAAADGVAGFHREGVIDVSTVKDVSPHHEGRDAADVVDVGVGDEDPVERGRAEGVERDGAGGGFVAGVEEDRHIIRPDEPGVDALLAEGQVEPVDEWLGQWLGVVAVVIREGVRVQAKH